MKSSIRQLPLIPLTLLCMCIGLLSPRPAQAFCGFYVSGADGALYNDATQVVLMRDGLRTVMSMQNHYNGPPEDFALVVPVPVVLQKENVKTLPHEIFNKIDAMAAPRLVEYWERDPCFVEPPMVYMMKSMAVSEGAIPPPVGAPAVRVEAQFAVGEYDIVILSADDATSLDTWLRQHKYNIPKGAEPVLKPYIEQGMRFFVAKVNLKKVKKVDGRAVLSPLRFHYDSEAFNLPVRLGLLNAHGPQDLIVHILAQNQRYDVANMPNVFIPTNLEVKETVKSEFGAFYAALFDATLSHNPGAVVTEYSWAASTCDPCPGPTLTQADFLTLGADAFAKDPGPGWVLTRLHARYTADQLSEDLIFRVAKPVVGGRERMGQKGLETGATPAAVNNFQGRYIIRHLWEGPIACENPVRGRWGGPPTGIAKPMAVKDSAFAPRGKAPLGSWLAEDVDEIGVKAMR